MQYMPFIPVLAPASLNTGSTIDASNEGVIVAFIAPKTGNIDRLVLAVETLTGTSPTFRWRFETPSTSASPPRGSGTLFHANGDVTSTLTAGKNVITFASAVPVTQGDFIVLVMSHHSGTIDASNNIILRNSMQATPNQQHTQRGFPCAATFAGAFFTTQQWSPPIVPLYDDDYPALSSILLSSTNSALNTTSGGEEGNKFTPNFDMEALGFFGMLRYVNGTATVFNFRLYDSAGNVLRSVLSTDGRWSNSSANQNGHFFPFEPLILEAGQSYRVGCHNTGSTGRVGLKTFYDAACKNIVYGDLFSELSRTTRTYNATWSEGGWTQDTASVSSLIPYLRGVNTIPSSSKRITSFIG